MVTQSSSADLLAGLSRSYVRLFETDIFAKENRTLNCSCRKNIAINALNECHISA